MFILDYKKYPWYYLFTARLISGCFFGLLACFMYTVINLIDKETYEFLFIISAVSCGITLANLEDYIAAIGHYAVYQYHINLKK